MYGSVRKSMQDIRIDQITGMQKNADPLEGIRQKSLHQGKAFPKRGNMGIRQDSDPNHTRSPLFTGTRPDGRDMKTS
jgi:hypothetical protein